jgi:DNA-binding IclR family transcriptional regulator
LSLVVDKALRLIDLVAAGQETLALLVKGSGLSRSTTHRLLSALVEHGYLAYDARRFELGYRLLELGEKKKRSLKFLDALQPTLRAYAELTRDTIHVAILDGTDMVLIERIAGYRELQIQSFVGQRGPAFKTAVGKVLISRQGPASWQTYIPNILKDYPKSRAEVRKELVFARKYNFAMDFDEIAVGTCGVAAAFRINEALDAAVSINGATVYFADNRLHDLAKVAVRLARELEDIISKQVRGPA